MTTEATKLTPKREKFCFEYLKDLNGVQAARRAGYSDKGSIREGSRLLAIAAVQDEIARLRSVIQSRTSVTPEKVVRELAAIAFADIGEVMTFGQGDSAEWDFSALPPEFSRAIQSVKIERFTNGRGARSEDVKQVQVKMHDKLASLGLLAKIYGMVRESVDINLTSDHDPDELRDVMNNDLRAFIDSHRTAVGTGGQRDDENGASHHDDTRETTARMLPTPEDGEGGRDEGK